MPLSSAAYTVQVVDILLHPLKEQQFLLLYSTTSNKEQVLRSRLCILPTTNVLLSSEVPFRLINEVMILAQSCVVSRRETIISLRFTFWLSLSTQRLCASVQVVCSTWNMPA